MKIILKKNKLSKFTHNKKSLGFVPTMGGLHKGHMSLIKRSIKECDMTVVSIFVNKQQFNRKTDYNKYPRFLNRDISLLRKLKIDFFKFLNVFFYVSWVVIKVTFFVKLRLVNKY